MYPTKVCRRHFFCQANILNVRDICLGNDIDVGIKKVFFSLFCTIIQYFFVTLPQNYGRWQNFFECCATIWDNIIVILQLNLDGGDAYSFLCCRLLSRCLCSVLISSKQSFPSAMNQKRRMCLSTLRKSFCLMQRQEHWLEDSCGCKVRLKTKIFRGCTTN